MRVIGMMSGTSFDAVDAAVADLSLTGDELVLHPRGLLGEPYPDDVLAAIQASMPPAATTMHEVCRLDTRIGQCFAQLAARADEELGEGRSHAVVSHGQTLFHWVEDGEVRGTLQLGQPAWIAERTGCTVVSDLRSRDIAAGGQGAPLVSMLEDLWLRGLAAERGPVVALNLGGIANVSLVSPDAPTTAWDTGPANALIDAYVLASTGLAYDADGRLGLSGQVLPELLEDLLAEPYLRQLPPKSTGKELFHLGYVADRVARVSERTGEPPQVADVVATLTAFTARSVADATRSANLVVAAGGGTRNPALMAALRRELTGELTTSEELGLPTQAKEAYAFAVLGFLTLHGLAATLPSSTGAGAPSVLGSITPGRRPLPLETEAQAPRTLRINP